MKLLREQLSGPCLALSPELFWPTKLTRGQFITECIASLYTCMGGIITGMRNGIIGTITARITVAMPITEITASAGMIIIHIKEITASSGAMRRITGAGAGVIAAMPGKGLTEGITEIMTDMSREGDSATALTKHSTIGITADLIPDGCFFIREPAYGL
jgi:hypothetical protein